MECPNCKKEVSLIPPAYRNLETYGGTVVATSECCGIAFTVGIKHSFSLRPYDGDSDVDDWGNKITKPVTNETN